MPLELKILESLGAAGSRIRELEAEITRLRAERPGWREALEFYANPFSAKDEYGDAVSVPDFYNELDFGERARAALHPSGTT